MTDYSSYKYYKVSKPIENVLHVEFNRPQVLNAVHHDSYMEYQDIFEKAEFDGDVRAIVLSGVGKAFCAGLDVKSVPDFNQGREEQARRAIALYHHIKEFQKAIHTPYRINKRE